MAYSISAKITLFKKSASIFLEEKESGSMSGSLSFLDGPLNLNQEMANLIGDNAAIFGSLPDLIFTDFGLKSFDKPQGSGMILEAQGSVGGIDFTFCYGTYSAVSGQKSAETFSLVLEPFQIEKLPIVNLPIDLKLDIQQAGYATGDYVNEAGKTVKAGVFMEGELVMPGLKEQLVYPIIAVEAAGGGGGQQPPNEVKGEVDWLEVDKEIGPAKLKQVGLQWKDGKIWVVINTNISFGGITLSLIGLKAGIEVGLPIGMPGFGLDGLGLSYAQDPIQMGGALVKVDSGRPGVTDQYDGAVSIQFTDAFMYGMGSYAKINGHDSIFVYAYVDYPLGGPAFFFVEGLALGFGYNRSFIAPTIDQLETFPLVTQAMGTSPVTPNDPMAMLQGLDAYLPPSEGELVLAVGIKFSTFKVVKSFLLLVASFGDKVTFDLLGMSRLTLPPESKKPVVFVEIVIKAFIDPEAGEVKVDGLITKNSYVYSRDAKLTGGFAFYSWFKDNELSGAKEGDFVLTMGGYHPDFKKPDHYPSVPRVALNWQVDKNLEVKGTAYFAITPVYGMAGFQLKATYKAGSLTAVFTQGADFLIQWKPFYYDITAYVNIRASFYAKIKLVFVTIKKTFHIDAGAQLHIWGPEFSGHADIHVKVLGVGFSFGVDFGAKSTGPAPLKLNEFREAFLPAPDKIISLTPLKGLLKVVKSYVDVDGNGTMVEKNTWVMNPKEIRFQVISEVPLSTIEMDGESKDYDAFGIAPMQLNKEDENHPEAKMVVTLTRVMPPANANTEPDFTYKVITKNMPAALWGKYEKKPKINATRIIALPVGVELSLIKEPEVSEPKPIAEENLDFDEETLVAAHSYDQQDFAYSDFTNFYPEHDTAAFSAITKGVNKLAESQAFLALPQKALLLSVS